MLCQKEWSYGYVTAGISGVYQAEVAEIPHRQGYGARLSDRRRDLCARSAHSGRLQVPRARQDRRGHRDLRHAYLFSGADHGAEPV